MKAWMGLLIVCAVSVNVFAEDKKRTPAQFGLADVQVQTITGSQNSITEKWIDKANKVVCYVGQGAGNDAGLGIACVKLDTVPQ